MFHKQIIHHSTKPTCSHCSECWLEMLCASTVLCVSAFWYISNTSSTFSSMHLQNEALHFFKFKVSETAKLKMPWTIIHVNNSCRNYSYSFVYGFRIQTRSSIILHSFQAHYEYAKCNRQYCTWGNKKWNISTGNPKLGLHSFTTYIYINLQIFWEFLSWHLLTLVIPRELDYQKHCFVCLPACLHYTLVIRNSEETLSTQKDWLLGGYIQAHEISYYIPTHIVQTWLTAST